MNKYPDRTSEVRSNQDLPTNSRKPSTIQEEWGSAAIANGYIRLPNAIWDIADEHSLPDKTVRVWSWIHQFKRVTGQGPTQQDILRVSHIPKPTLHRLLEACAKANHCGTPLITKQGTRKGGRYEITGVYQALNDAKQLRHVEWNCATPHDPHQEAQPQSSTGQVQDKPDDRSQNETYPTKDKSQNETYPDHRYQHETYIGINMRPTIKPITMELHENSSPKEYIKKRSIDRFLTEEIDTQGLPEEPPRTQPPPAPPSPPSQPADVGTAQVHMFREVLDHPESHRVLMSANSTHEDVRALVRDAMHKGLGATEIISALNAAGARRVDNPVAYARTCLRNARPKLVLLTDAAREKQDHKAKEAQRQREAKKKQVIQEQEQIGRVFAGSAYAEIRAFAAQHKRSLASLAAWVRDDIPDPKMLLEAMRAAQEQAGGQPSYMFGVAFMKALETAKATPNELAA